MQVSEASRLRKAWPWLVVLVLILAGMTYLLAQHLGSSITAAATVDLDNVLISTDGLLIAFTGIIFTGMLAEIRFRTERAMHTSDPRRIDRLERTSKSLRKAAFVSFLFFAASLADTIGNLPDPLSSPSSSFSLTTNFDVPVALMVGGLVFLMVALALTASE